MNSYNAYQEYEDEIHLLFSSKLRLRIAFSLLERHYSVDELMLTTESAHSSIINYTKKLLDLNFIKKSNGNYSLTQTGNLVFKKISGTISLFDSLHENGQKSDFTLKNNSDILTILRSSILIKILILLNGNEKQRSELRNLVGLSSPALTPKLRFLEENNLILQTGSTCSLSEDGKKLADRISDFILCTATIYKHNNYFKSHCLEELPDFALESIGELYETNIIYDTTEKPFKNYENWMRVISEAEYMHSVSNYTTVPVSDAVAKEVYGKGLILDAVVTKEVAEELCGASYTKYMKDISFYTNVRFHIAEIPSSFGFTVTDKCLTIKFISKDKRSFDTSSGIVSRSKKSREWGEKLYNYYLSDSIPLSDFIKDKYH